MTSNPRITFGIIVLNGEPFTRYNLRSLYPFAHEIIVVEGASIKARSIATQDGHSLDNTLEILRRFKNEEDPENKVTVITAEDSGYENGFWPGDKDEQSKAYAQRATGDYLWQVDIDEFYKPEDIKAILNMLGRGPKISQMNVQWLNFWGGFDALVEGLFIQQHYNDLGGGVPRIFKWGEGHTYLAHRPPTVEDKNGKDTRKGRWIKGTELAAKGIYCYHYGEVFPQSVHWKMKYYSSMGWDNHHDLLNWYENAFLKIKNPYRVHHVMDEISWLTTFNGSHPPIIKAMREDISNGKIDAALRRTDDIDTLLKSRLYNAGVSLLQKYGQQLLKLEERLPFVAKAFKNFIEAFFIDNVKRREWTHR